MNDPYLWDRSGPPDAEVQKLEALLQPFRDTRGLKPGRDWRKIWIPMGIAAALAGLIAIPVSQRKTPDAPAWTITALSGTARETLLRPGEWLETNTEERVQLDLDTTGRVEVEPRTRIRVVSAPGQKQRLALARGRMRAIIWAPPGQFSVATPSATAVDLGCMYTVETDSRGYGVVQVEAGWVALEDYGRESFIPAGATCRTAPKRGPGVPFFEDSDPALRKFVTALDASGDSSGLADALRSARVRDGVTLWHLFVRLPASERSALYNRFAALIPIPPSITRAALVNGNQQAIDALWATLGYGDTAWWRMWKSHTLSR